MLTNRIPPTPYTYRGGGDKLGDGNNDKHWIQDINLETETANVSN